MCVFTPLLCKLGLCCGKYLGTWILLASDGDLRRLCPLLSSRGVLSVALCFGVLGSSYLAGSALLVFFTGLCYAALLPA